MKKILAGLVIAGFLMGIGLPVPALAREPSLDGVVYWSEDEVNSLFSPDLMRTLNLTHSQRNAFQELRGRDWGYRPDHRYSRDLDALFSLGRVMRPGGSRVVIERGGSNDLDTFLAILAFGLLVSQAQDNDRYYDYDYGYGYGSGRWIRIDDFLYMFLRILDMNQRRTFTVYFDRWYDDYYYRRDYRRDYRRGYERYYWKMMRDWDRRLRLSEKQRRDMERYFRDLHNRQWEKDRRYRDLEKDYLRRSWDRDSFRDIDRYRRDLLKYRRESLEPPRDARDRFRTILDNQQRKTFDSMIREQAPRQLVNQRPAPPKFQNKPAPPKFQNKPAPPKFQDKPAPPKFQDKPAPPKFQNKPAPPKFQDKPAPPKFQDKPAPPKFQNKPAPPKFQNKPAPPKLPQNPGPAPGQKKPGPPIVKKPVKDGK